MKLKPEHQLPKLDGDLIQPGTPLLSMMELEDLSKWRADSPSNRRPVTVPAAQGSAEWLAARVGVVTASRVKDLLSKGRGTAPSAARQSYLAQIVAERLTGVSCDNVVETAPMRWGKEQEPHARRAYEARTGVKVVETGLVLHPSFKHAGASPDGLVGEDGLIEIKCPNTQAHIETMLRGTEPSQYYAQMQWQLCCTQRKWCDFVSYDPRLPERMSLFVHRVVRDQEYIVETVQAVTAFLLEVEDVIARLEKAAQQ